MNELEISSSQRLDQRVIELFPEMSRSFAVRLIEDKKVSVNNKIVTKAGYKIKQDDVVEVEYIATENQQIPKIELPILYEDDDCVVIHKPVGLLTHSKGTFNPEATVATWLSFRVNGMEGERAGIVHRLDRATSGVMICAKTPEALSWLQKQFAQRRTKKTYNALIEGTLQPKEAIIDMPIERNPKKPQTFRVGGNGKPAKTHYKILKNGKNYSLVELKPETGRTHQLRVHLKQLGHPIVGDTLYDGRSSDRLYLHALSLELTLPNQERKVFATELPEAFYTRLRDG
jgi:23S rRNA pseudouridine1911/1915/1917 synthase